MGTTQEWPGGVEARPMRKTDAKAWAELMAAAEAVDDTGEHYSVEDLEEELEDPKVNLETDLITLWHGDVMVGYGGVRGPDEVIDVARIDTQGTVHPEWRRHGLGNGLLTWFVERGAGLHSERYAEFPGEVHTYSEDTNTFAREMMIAGGFEPCRYFFDMRRPLQADPIPATPLPDGLRLITFDWQYDEAVRVAHNEAFRDHWGSSAKDAETWKTWFTGSRAFRPELCALVLDGDQVAAYTLSYVYDAETEATGVKEVYVGQVGTRREYRGKGAARAALAHALRTAEESGCERAALNVDGENPTGALGLYQSLGFTTSRQSTRYRRPIA